MKGARDIELRIPEEDIRYHTVLKEHSKVSHVDASHNRQVPPRDPQHGAQSEDGSRVPTV